MGALAFDRRIPVLRTILTCAACAILVSAPPPSQRSPARTVQLQIEAFNAHDLGAFAATFAEDVEGFDFPATPQGPKGRAALQETYGKRFQDQPDLHASVKEQMVSGAFVIQKERVSGRGAGKPVLEAVVIYQVEAGLIRKMWTLP